MYKRFAVAWVVLCLTGAPAMANEPEQPSLELLEFLGDWSVDEEGWLDPVELEEMNLQEQEHDNDEKDK
jgi:hypothetical protein